MPAETVEKIATPDYDTPWRDLQREYRDEIERFEEERKMPYVTTIERMGIEKGLQQGLEQGLEQGRRQASEGFVLRYLKHRFGELNKEMEAAIQALSLDRITQLSNVMFDFESLGDVILWLRENASSQ